MFLDQGRGARPIASGQAVSDGIVGKPMLRTPRAGTAIECRELLGRRLAGQALAQLLGNVTPGNADFVKRSIAPVLAPSIYQDTMNALFQQVEQIKLDRVSTRLDPREVIYEPKTGKVFITGYSVAAGPAGKEERDTRTYEFIIRVHNYQPLVTYIDTYRGAPHTLENNERAGTQAARETRQPDGSAEADAGNTKEKR